MRWRYRHKILLAGNLLLLAALLFGGYKKSLHNIRKTEVSQVLSKNVEKAEKKKIALTFDDGPHPSYTPELLDGLKERNIKATFFVIGENAENNPDIIKRMHAEGHLIGNHTYDHVELSSLSLEKACDQIIRTDRVIENLTGNHTEFVRPPFGVWKKGLECGIEMFQTMWTIDPLDWTTANVEGVVRKVVTVAKENDIILLHDYYKSSVQAALQIVDILTKEGFEFVTVEELMLE